MSAASSSAGPSAGHMLVQRLLAGGIPRGLDFDACRALLRSTSIGDAASTALCMLLEGALADAALGIDDTRTVVDLLKGLARGTVTPEELL
jgi:hypothetical protein